MWRTIAVMGLMAAASVAAGAGDVKPRIETGKDGRPELVLPDSLKAAMKRHNPKMQLREWSEYDPDLVQWFRKEHADAVPWAICGDFDGNGKSDVVLQMRDAEGSLFKLIAYHQQRNGEWVPYLLAQSGADLTILASGKSIGYLTLCRGGQSVHYWPEHDRANEVRSESDLPRMWLQHDAITNVAFGKAAVTHYWKGGRYHRIITAD